jgi:hypothetical protein
MNREEEIMNGDHNACDELQAQLDDLRVRIDTWETLRTSFEQLAAYHGTGPDAERYAQRAASAAATVAELRAQVRAVERALEACLEERRMQPPSITITGIEQTQATQFFRPAFDPCPDRTGAGPCPENDIRLIAGKTTVLRAYVDVTIGTPSVTALSGILETRQAGSATWDLPLTPYNAPITARRAADIDRGIADHTLNFRIPAARCQGTLETRLTVFDPAHPGETNYTSPSVSRPLQFTRVLPLMLRLIRIRYANAARGLSVPAPTVDDFWTTAEYVRKTYPIAEIELVAESEELYDGDFTSFFDTSPGASGTTGAIFTIIDRIKAAEQHPSVVKYYALFDGSPNQSGYGGWGVAPDRAAGVVFSGPTMAQEIGHTCGRAHAPCGVGDADPMYPNYIPHRSGSIGEFGFDVIDSVVHHPADTYDFMSYCGPTWVSPYTYEALMNCFPAPGSGGGAPAERLPGWRREFLHLFLTIFRDGRVVMRGPGFHLLGERPEPAGDPTPYFVELLDEAGHILEAQRLRLADVHRSLDDASLDFPVALAWRAPARKLVVKREQEILHALEVAHDAPKVAFSAGLAGKTLAGEQQIAWRAQGGAEPLSYVLRYSHDGATWRRLAGPLGDDRHTVDFDALPGGDACWLQVLASGGLRTGVASSGPFAVARKPRRPVILSPQDGAKFDHRATVQLYGAAVAPGGESAPAEVLAWASSIDGHLGTGTPLHTHTLTPGRHCVTLSVDDGCGGETSTSIFITVSLWREPTSWVSRVDRAPR